MEPSDIQDDQEHEAQARHAALLEALEGARELTWSIWASPLHESRFLTDDGRRLAEWAVEVLRNFLGDDFLERVRTARIEHALLSGAILTSLWPMIDSRRVYEDVFRLAAQIRVCAPDTRGWQGTGLRDLRTTMRQNFDQTSWTHCLIQLELAALALRQGWAYEFEGKLSTGKRGDVRLERDGRTIAIEVTSVGWSAPQHKAVEYFQAMTMRILAIEMQYGVHIRGNIGEVVPPEVSDRWIADIEAAAQAAMQDRREHYVPGPAEGAVRVSPEAFDLNEIHLEGPARSTDIWGRINGRIGLKGRKTAGSGVTWIRLQEHAGLWLSMLGSHRTFEERVATITPHIRAMLEPFPHVAGVILSPGLIWQDDEPGDQTITVPEIRGVVALRRPVAQARLRETVIVGQFNEIDAGVDALIDLYGCEGDWLEWALEKLDHPELDALFQ